MQITFRDDANNMTAEARNFNYILRGDMAQDNANLKMELKIEGIDFWMGGIRLANNVSAGFISDVAADIKNMGFIIRDNRFNLNDIVLKFDGSVEARENDINMDITFASERTDFKNLLSLIPAIYMNNFRNLTTTGNLTLNGNIKGAYNENTMPNANINLSVDNATFKYPDLPKSVEKIYITAKANYDGAVFDRTTVDVDRLSFEMAGNPFNTALHLKTPESDPQVSAKFSGKIDFDSIADIIPLDNMTLNGLLECDISISGKMSTLESRQYDDFQAAGSLKLSGFNFESPDFQHEVKITNTQLNFTPRWVELANFNAVIGRSDIAMRGSLENFIPFVLRNDTVRGTLALRSNTIDLNEFMSGQSGEKTTPADSSPLSVIEVPKNVNFAVTVDIGQILFDKLVITNTAGALSVRDGKVTMQNLGMNLLEGNMTLNGEYNTQVLETPFVDFDMNIRQFDISSALASFKVLEKILPESQNYVGRVSATLTLNSVLDEHLSPVLEKIHSRGRLQTQNLELRNSKLFGTMADLLHNDRWRTPAPGNINIGYEIRDGQLWINDPIVMNMPPARIAISGSQGLGMTLNYRVDATMPVSAIGSGAANLLSRIPGGSAVSEFQLTGLIQGAVRNPEIRLGIADMANTITEAVREQVMETVTQRVEEVTAQVTEEINRQIDEIMAEAQRQADNIRNTTSQAADRVRREANTAADRLISEAAGRSAVERTLAQTAANRLRSEAETNVRRLEQEGENKINAIMNSAQARADELRRN